MALIRKGFTLVELMIAMAIVGLLMVMSVPMYLNQKESSSFQKDATTLFNLLKLAQSNASLTRTYHYFNINNGSESNPQALQGADITVASVKQFTTGNIIQETAFTNLKAWSNYNPMGFFPDGQLDLRRYNTTDTASDFGRALCAFQDCYKTKDRLGNTYFYNKVYFIGLVPKGSTDCLPGLCYLIQVSMLSIYMCPATFSAGAFHCI